MTFSRYGLAGHHSATRSSRHDWFSISQQALAVLHGDTPLAYRTKNNLSAYVSSLWVSAITSAQNAALAIDLLGSAPVRESTNGFPAMAAPHNPHSAHRRSSNTTFGSHLSSGSPGPQKKTAKRVQVTGLRKVQSEPMPAVIDLGNGQCLVALDEKAVVRELVEENSRLLALEHEVHAYGSSAEGGEGILTLGRPLQYVSEGCVVIYSTQGPAILLRCKWST